jgi:phytoene dehydrogenase-like protein
MHQQDPVIVVGGGIAGLTAAAFIAKAQVPVLLFEKEEKTGGLVNSFERNGYVFDGGIRAIEDSGIIFPMLRQLGIEIEMIKSQVSIGIGDRVIRLKDKGSLEEYEHFLIGQFPDREEDVRAIIREIRKIMQYMDVLYGIDNPVFLDPKKDRKYMMKTMLPWLFKYLFTIPKIMRLDRPVDEYLRKFTDDQSLNDIIAQHFFQKTPTFFALSYFSLYLDYRYPRGGTGVLTEKMDAFVREHGGMIKTGTRVVSVDPEKQILRDDKGAEHAYSDLIWAADLKSFYSMIDPVSIRDTKIKMTVMEKQEIMKDLHGCDSIFTLYLGIDREKEHFSNICSEHFFYTPDRSGLSRADGSKVDLLLDDPSSFSLTESKKTVKAYLDDYFRFNTYEISIPVLRDPNLAPTGKTGLIISTLFDHALAKHISDAGWYEEFKTYAEECMIRTLENSIFPDLGKDIEDRFSSTPLSLERYTGNTDGAITGWAFTNPRIPVVNKLTKMFYSADAPLPHVHQAGQWTYSPAGLPISVMTGKLAANKVLKGK